MHIVFIGPPGAGKGTQCVRLVDFLQIPHLSTGEMLRNVKSQKTALARWVASYLDKGQLAPDHLVMRIVGQRLEAPDCASGALFDGFPRTIVQAQLLDDYFAERHTSINLVINLIADKEVLVERMLSRAKTEGRADDTEQTIQARLKVFEEQTAPLIEYYTQQKLVESIDAMQKPDEVFETLRNAVASRMGPITDDR